MRRPLVAAFVCLLASANSQAQISTPIDTTVCNELVAYVTAHHQTPEDYVVSKFTDHDVVFLGENHYIKHDPELVQRLIPLVYKTGVYCLGSEDARRVDQPLLDSLLEGKAFDEALAKRVMFNQFVHWAFKEYLDIFRSAWQLNRSLPEGSRHFRILGLNNNPDWSVVKTQADREDPVVKRKVWHGEDEGSWARVLLDSVVAKGEKALVYSGAHHAFTGYRQPIVMEGKFVRFGDVRCGNHVYDSIGARAFTVFLHAPWVNAEGYDKPAVLAADGYIDAALDVLPPQYQSFGVDTKGTPFGKLPGETSLYKFGYTNFTLDTIYDGYICQGPLSSYEGVTVIPDFVTPENLEQARAQSPNPFFRTATIEDFHQAALEDVDLKKYLPHR